VITLCATADVKGDPSLGARSAIESTRGLVAGMAVVVVGGVGVVTILVAAMALAAVGGGCGSASSRDGE
jgi:hypothetical protein